MENDTLNEAKIPDDSAPEMSGENIKSEETQQEENTPSKSPQSISEAKDDLINQYRKSIEAENTADADNVASTIELMRQAEINRGMQFSGSYIDRATFIMSASEHQVQPAKEPSVNLLGETDKEKFLLWCVEQYQNFCFSMLLAVCILDRQPYQTIYQMARELQDILSDTTVEADDEKKDWISKSNIVATLGIIQYSDITSVRGVDLEVEFLRLPVHEQAEHYIQLMVNEFSELKSILTKYLTEKISKTYGTKHNYIVISGCMEALSYIGMTDLQFFNDQIIPRFLLRKNICMDYCVAVLLGKLYKKRESRDFVKACTVQWGQLKNNPHNLLAALYVCSILGNQENLVHDIWMNVLDQLVEELINGKSLGKISHIDMLQGLFKSGNRNISYYKGVIHAFHMQILRAENNWEQEKLHLLNTIFFLFLFEDYVSCNISENKSSKREMIWIKIFQKLDTRTGKELTDLWCMLLDSNEYSKECWKLLEDYLEEYQNYEYTDVEILTFFFYHINYKLGNNQVIYFLEECTKKSEKTLPIAMQIYEELKE